MIESDDATLKRAIMASSSRSVLPTAPRKIARTHTYRFGDLSDLDLLLTTSGIDDEELGALREAGLDVELIGVV